MYRIRSGSRQGTWRLTRLLQVVVVLLFGLLALPAVAMADANTIPTTVDYATNPQPGSGNQYHAPFQWWKVDLVAGDSLSATLTVTSEAGDDVYLRLYPPGTTDTRQVGVGQVSSSPLTWKANTTGVYYFVVYSFDAYDTSYTFVWTRTPARTLRYVAGRGGTISGVTSQTVSDGGDGTAVRARPAAGYHFVDWSDGSTANPRTDTHVTANIDVTANFKANPMVSTTTRLWGPASVNVKTSCGIAGAVSPSAAPGKVTITITRKAGATWWSFASPTVGGTAGRFKYTFKPPYKGQWCCVAKYLGGMSASKTYRSSTSLAVNFTVK